MGRSPRHKRIRKAMREFYAKAYDRELSAALSELEAKFKAWRAGEIDTFELNSAVHEHHDGISRDLWTKYGLKPEMMLPTLVVQGVISESELPEDLLAEMRETIESMRGFEKAWGGQQGHTED